MDEKDESTSMDEPMDVVEDQEASEEKKDEQNEPEDESVKEEASEEKVDDHEKDKPVPKSTRKRGGGRRKRRKPAAAIKEESSKEPSSKQIDETEIEVSAENSNDAQEEENDDDDDDGEKEPEREPSPVMTRRSNRKLQQFQKTEQNSEQVEEFESTEEVIKQENDPDIEKCDDDEESIASEMDSVASNSTITTKGSRGNRSQDSRKKVKNGKGGKAKSTNSSNGNGSASVTTSTKGKSRRIIFKKSATRAPSAIARAVTSDRIYYKGQYFTKGDIVSVEDMDGSVYYAQLRGFLTDQYCEKSGVITWLLPTVNSPPSEDSFDPSTYVIGPEEDLPRKLDYFTFVMHAPDDYFYYRNAPYPTTAIETDQEYLITRQGPKVRVIKAGQPVYQESIPPLIPLPASVGGSS